jgi:hypothetical protein
MSTSAVVDAWQADIPPLQKLVLLAFCDGVSCDGSLHFNLARTMRRCSMAEPVLCKVLDDLVAGGWIGSWRIDNGAIYSTLIGYGEKAA